MKHHHITRVLYLAMIGFLATAGAVIFLYSQATPVKALPLFIPYGGTVGSIPVANPLPPPAIGLNQVCPYYTVVDNDDLDNGLGPIFGVFVPELPPGITYDFGNLYTPDTPLLGGVEPIPCVGGTAPMPIYPIFYDGLFYLTGTGDL